MAKKRLSGLYITLAFFALVINKCQENNFKKIEILDRNQNAAITFLKTYPLDKSSLMTSTFDFISENGDVFYFSNIYTRAIYKTQRPFIKYEKLGKNGNGPGEYMTPYKLFVHDNKLFFSDVNNGFLKYLYLKKNIRPIDKYINYLIKGAKNFVIGDNYFITLNTFFNPRLSLYTLKDGILLDSLVTLPRLYDKINLRMMGGDIVKGPNGNIYFSCVSPYIIFKVSIKNKKLVLKEKWNFENEDGFIPWTEDKLIEMKRSKSKKKKWDILGSTTRLASIKLISDNNSKYLISYLTHGQNKENELNIYHIISMEGKILKKYKSNSLKLIGTVDKNLFFLKYDPISQESSIEEYVFKEEFFK